jgi:hypothetical protein
MSGRPACRAMSRGTAGRARRCAEKHCRIGVGQMVRPGGAGLRIYRPDPYQARPAASPGGSLRERASVVGDAHSRCPAPGAEACSAGPLDRRGRPRPRRAGAAAAEGMQSDIGSHRRLFKPVWHARAQGSGSLNSLFYAVKIHISILTMILGPLAGPALPDTTALRMHDEQCSLAAR